MIAETDRVQVRPLIESDLTDYQRVLAFPVMAQTNAGPADLSPELLATNFERDRHNPYAFAVIERRHRRFVGAILYYSHEATPASSGGYDVGYFLDPLFWGRGLMTEAVAASWTLLTKPVTVWAACLETNYRSQRVLTKLDFVPAAATTTVAANTTTPVRWYHRGLPAD